ncbi:MAG: RDD family protein [Nitrospirota bacterium]
MLVAIEDHKYPTLTRRYVATAIDVAFILAAIILISYLFDDAGSIGVRIRVGLILFLFFMYEPLCTSQLCTLGQKIMGVRVRRYPSMERISLLMAYARIIVKGLLGILSFFTLPFSQNRRAIHDMAAKSIVIFADK